MNSCFRAFVVLCSIGAAVTGVAQSYLKVIGQPGRSESGSVVYQSPAGELYIGGSVNDSAMVQRIDANGDVLWSRRFRTPGVMPKCVLHLTSAPDGTVIGCGYGRDAVGNPGEGFRFRIDALGNMIWVRYWADPELSDRRIYGTNAGEYLMFSSRVDLAGGTFTDIFTSRIDAGTGDLISSTGLLDLNANVPYVDDMIAMTTIGSSHYAVTSTYVAGSPLSGRRVALSKFDANGQHLTTSYLLYPDNVDRRIYASDICANGDSLTISYFGDINGSSTNWTQGLIRCDTTGAVAWARDFNVGGSGQEISSRVVSTTFGYLVAARTSLTTPSRLFLQAVSPSGVLLWTKSYGNVAQAQGLWENTPANLADVGGGFLLTGHVDQGAGELDLLLIRTDIDGEIACTQVNTLNAITTVLPDLTYASVVQENFFTPNTGLDGIVVEDAGIDDLCVLDVALGNDTSLCGSITLDAGVPNAIYEWQDGTTGQTLEAIATGTYWVRVTVDCCVASDTVEVEIGELAELDLGNDTTMCEGDLLIFQPPFGSWTYLWSDGTTDPELLVFGPGTYWVELSDGSCTASDTVEVTQVSVPTVSLGTDSISCDGTPILFDPVTTNTTTYVWNDGSADSTLQVTTSGEVWVRVGNACGFAFDTLNVTVAEAVLLNLGPDTVICATTTIQLEADYPGWTLQWSDGSQDNTFTITTGGDYWLDVVNGGCVVTDSISVIGRAVPDVTLGPDTVVCGGADLLLQPVLLDVDDVLWSDGSTADTLLVTGSGTYDITVSNICGNDQDAMVVTIVEPLAIGLGPDTLLCGTDSLVLDLTAAGAELLWQDGSTADVFVVTTPGTYSVEGVILSCTAQDTVVVDYTRLAEMELGEDTVLCTIPVITLDAGVEGDNAVWQDNSVGRTYDATRTGLYIASITNYCGTVSDSVRISFAVPEVAMDDVDLCPGEKVVLDPQGEMVETVWTTGDTARTITVGEGAYGYLATDIHGCEHTDLVIVRITSGLDGTVYIPNAFTPDADGINERFLVAGPESADFELVLFDRWGQELYRTIDPYKGWDGTFGGQEAPQDVYVYTVTYADRCNANNTLVTTRGHVTLIR